MTHALQVTSSGATLPPRHSRRGLLRRGGALGFSLLAAAAGWPRSVRAGPAVIVGAPNIDRIEECVATVSVDVSVSDIPPGVRYEAAGDILEADKPDGEDDYCCPLSPQTTPPAYQQETTLRLTKQVMAPDLGLLHGMGPATDETANPERVALFARIWLWDLETGDRFGPWDSPPRIAVPNPRLVWTPRNRLPGSELMMPRTAAAFSSNDSIGLPLPPAACIS